MAYHLLVLYQHSFWGFVLALKEGQKLTYLMHTKSRWRDFTENKNGFHIVENGTVQTHVSACFAKICLCTRNWSKTCLQLCNRIMGSFIYQTILFGKLYCIYDGIMPIFDFEMCCLRLLLHNARSQQ